MSSLVSRLVSRLVSCVKSCVKTCVLCHDLCLVSSSFFLIKVFVHDQATVWKARLVVEKITLLKRGSLLVEVKIIIR